MDGQIYRDAPIFVRLTVVVIFNSVTLTALCHQTYLLSIKNRKIVPNFALCNFACFARIINLFPLCDLPRLILIISVLLSAPHRLCQDNQCSSSHSLMCPFSNLIVILSKGSSRGRLIPINIQKQCSYAQQGSFFFCLSSFELYSQR